MNKSFLCFLSAVIVAARCNAQSIPALSNTSGIAVAHSIEADEHDKRNFRLNDGALNEEREIFPIESFTPSIKIADESLPGTIHAADMIDMPQMKENHKTLPVHEANTMDVLQIKERNEVLATRMEKLGININGVVSVARASEFDFKKFSTNNLEWMVLGKVYFEKAGGSTGYYALRASMVFHAANMKIIDNKGITKWTARIRSLHVKVTNVFDKMLWLIQHQNELNLHIADAAKMAFGSEYLIIRTLPISDLTIKVVTEQNLDKDVMESLIRQDMELGNSKRRPFAIESFTSSVKDANANADKSLPRTKPTASMMDVSQIKELNKVLASRIEKLGIDIDGVVFLANALKAEVSTFNLNNLEWMFLGKIFFEKAGSSTGYKSLSTQELFEEVNMAIIDFKEIKIWAARLHGFGVRVTNVSGKMLWLIEHQNELNLHIADAAKMAFGSEYLIIRTLPISDLTMKVVTEQNLDKDVMESLIRQDMELGNSKRRPFAIESFTSSVKDANANADKSLPRTKPTASMMDVSQIKELNKVLATRIEKLGIDIDGVVFLANALKAEVSTFNLNNLEWMFLGKIFFEKAGSSTGYKSLSTQEMFEEANIEITDSKEIKIWAARLHGFGVGAKKVFGRMLWLIEHQNELNLHIGDAAKMAFGSEYLEGKEFPISDGLIEALTEHDVDKGVSESLIRHDKDSTMKDIARDTLQEKATRKYVLEDLPQQPNKHRKLA